MKEKIKELITEMETDIPKMRKTAREYHQNEWDSAHNIDGEVQAYEWVISKLKKLMEEES